MKLTWSWLKDHLDTNLPLQQITDALTALGLEVEGVADRGEALKPFTIARVIDAKPHPDADTLKLCTIDTGDATVEVVCGAPNAEKGLIGVFAPVGAYVPGINTTLREVEIRGVKSSGMMCSEREMMLSEEHDGIISLPQDAPVGSSFAVYAGLDDQVIDIAITPDRADCLGVRGVARDLAAMGLGTLKPLDLGEVKGQGKSRISWKIDLPQDQKHLCPRIAGRSFSGLENSNAPQWMQQRLKAVGQRPISALVDITNYIMIDIGRPLHVYDTDKIKGDELTVRLGRKNEQITALNEKTYQMDETMLVIADADGADDLAGIMGGERTGVVPETTEVFLEMAIFDPATIAATGRKLNINSDARYRFERGLDVTSPDWAMDYASRMIVSLCGGEASLPVVAGDGADWQRSITYHPSKCLAMTSVDVSAEKQRDFLAALGFEVTGENNDTWQVSPPPWRGDIVGGADLVAEIIRVNGYDAIPILPLPRDRVVSQPAVTPRQRRPFIIRRLLAERGMNEVVTFSFLRHDIATRYGGGDDALKLVNPISTDLDTMRPSLLPNLIDTVARNLARGETDIAIFEIGPIFYGDQPQDQCAGIAGIRRGLTAKREWTREAREIDWLDAKGDAVAVLESLGIAADSVQARREAPPWYHPGQSGALCQGREVLAYFGALHPALLKDHDVSAPAAAFEMKLDNLRDAKASSSRRPLAKLSPFQAVARDFAFILDHEVTAENLIRAVKGAAKTRISDVIIFDVYQGAGIEAGKKSLALAVILQPIKATMTEDEIEAVSSAIIEAVKKHCGGELRG